jgi:hypothetical protein
MEFLDLFYLAVVAILAIFVAVSAVVFTFLQQRWYLLGHGDSEQQMERREDSSHVAAFLGGLVCYCGKQVQGEGLHLSAAAI